MLATFLHISVRSAPLGADTDTGCKQGCMYLSRNTNLYAHTCAQMMFKMHSCIAMLSLLFQCTVSYFYNAIATINELNSFTEK